MGFRLPSFLPLLSALILASPPLLLFLPPLLSSPFPFNSLLLLPRLLFPSFPPRLPCFPPVLPPRPCAPSLARAFRLPFARTCPSLPPLPLSSSVCFRTGAISSFFAFRISSPRPFGAQRLTAMFSVFQLQPLQPLIALL